MQCVVISNGDCCYGDRDRSLIDEEDELLYGDDNMMVKKEEIKS